MIGKRQCAHWQAVTCLHFSLTPVPESSYGVNPLDLATGSTQFFLTTATDVWCLGKASTNASVTKYISRSELDVMIEAGLPIQCPSQCARHEHGTWPPDVLSCRFLQMARWQHAGSKKLNQRTKPEWILTGHYFWTTFHWQPIPFISLSFGSRTRVCIYFFIVWGSHCFVDPGLMPFASLVWPGWCSLSLIYVSFINFWTSFSQICPSLHRHPFFAINLWCLGPHTKFSISVAPFCFHLGA